jgi:hypothetical protein
VPAGSGPITLTVTGSGFGPGATVLVSGRPRPTTLVDPFTLTAALEDLDTASAGATAIRVQAAPTGGGQSPALALALTPAAPPVLQAPPRTVAGPPGGRLTCSPGTWAPTPAALAYRWLRDGRPIDGADGPSYRPTLADAGRAISCEVTATARGGPAVARSAPVRIAPASPPAASLVGPLRARQATLRVALRLARPVSGLAVRVQRSRNGVWTTLLTLRVSGRSAVLRPRLGPGRHVLRAVYGPPGRSLTTRPLRITVVP